MSSLNQAHGTDLDLSGGKEIAPVPESETIVGKNEGRKSNASQCSVEMADLETGLRKSDVSSRKTGRDCRICHLSIDATHQDSGSCFELGCSCKDDLGAAHKQCAEVWFRIKGNKTCEICGSTARNVSETALIVSWNEAASTTASEPTETVVVERRRTCQRHRFLNFLVACMVFAFILSWLFHFKIRP